MQDNECPCCGNTKVTMRSEESKKSLLNRLNRITGQLNGIKGMIENDRYCADILMQCAAVDKALAAVEREILSSHLHHCVARDIREGKDEVIDETMTIIGRLMR